MRSRLLSALAAAVALVTLAGCGWGTPAAAARKGEADAVIATVDGAPITHGDLDRRLRRAGPVDEADEPSLRAAFLDQLVDERLLVAEAQRRGLSISTAEVDAAVKKAKAALGRGAYGRQLEAEGLTDEGFRAQVHDALLIRTLLATVPKPRPITEHDVRTYYAAHRAEFAQPAQFRARIITTATRRDADAVLAELAGGADFATLAAQKSTSPERERGGDLGLVPRGQLPPEFDAALERLGPGELSPVVASPYGFHVLRLEERLPAAKRTLDQARAEIFQVLNTSRLEAAHESWLAQLRGKAKLEILDPALAAARAADPARQ